MSAFLVLSAEAPHVFADIVIQNFGPYQSSGWPSLETLAWKEAGCYRDEAVAHATVLSLLKANRLVRLVRITQVEAPRVEGAM